ncbi:MAG: hypothetical protein JNK05_40055 [Myxococcales bacterium]|nr:hypothetical protein [Myxococcales bacterium]
MRIVLSIVLLLHGLLCVLGFAKAFSLAALPALALPISKPMGVVWLASAALLIASAAGLAWQTSWCWVVALLGAILAQVAIVASWQDARFGTLGNLLALFVALYAAFAWGPFGFRAEYHRRARAALERASRAGPPRVVTEADLASLPDRVQRYLRFVGVVGRPLPRAFRVHFSGRIRSAANAPWMPFEGEQTSVVSPGARLFILRAARSGVPFDALHAYEQNAARMRVRVLSLAPMVDASGEAFSKTETVTLFNDLCIMAPAALIDPSIRWRVVDDRQVEATYTQGPHTIRATLVFGDAENADALVDFYSDDRPALAPDNTSFVPQRWSTPIREYRVRDGVRLASRGEGRYHPASGAYAYIEFSDLRVAYE